MSESQVAEGSVGRAQCNRSAVGGQRAFSTIMVGLYRFVTKHRAFFPWRDWRTYGAWRYLSALKLPGEVGLIVHRNHNNLDVVLHFRLPCHI